MRNRTSLLRTRVFGPHFDFFVSEFAKTVIVAPDRGLRCVDADVKLRQRVRFAALIAKCRCLRRLRHRSIDDFEGLTAHRDDRPWSKTQELALAWRRSNSILVPPRSEQAHCIRCKARVKTTSLILEHGSSMPRILSPVAPYDRILRTGVPTRRPLGRVPPTGRRLRTVPLRVRHVAPSG